MQLANSQIDPQQLFSVSVLGRNTVARSRGERLYSQGDKADTVFYIHRGYVKLTVVSPKGKEAVVGLLGPASFLGHACLSGHSLRDSTATPICDCTITKIDQSEMNRLLHEEPQFCRLFLAYALGRNVQLEADLADQLFNPCEMRLARALIRLTATDREGGSVRLLSNIDQQTLA